MVGKKVSLDFTNEEIDAVRKKLKQVRNEFEGDKHIHSLTIEDFDNAVRDARRPGQRKNRIVAKVRSVFGR